MAKVLLGQGATEIDYEKFFRISDYQGMGVKKEKKTKDPSSILGNFVLFTGYGEILYLKYGTDVYYRGILNDLVQLEKLIVKGILDGWYITLSDEEVKYILGGGTKPTVKSGVKTTTKTQTIKSTPTTPSPSFLDSQFLFSKIKKKGKKPNKQSQIIEHVKKLTTKKELLSYLIAAGTAGKNVLNLVGDGSKETVDKYKQTIISVIGNTYETDDLDELHSAISGKKPSQQVTVVSEFPTNRDLDYDDGFSSSDDEMMDE
jgi:hypothetical protein